MARDGRWVEGEVVLSVVVLLLMAGSSDGQHEDDLQLS